MNVVITGSIAFDYLMSFPGRFSDHILPDKIDRISLSFLVDSLIRQPGGIAANIAYSLALLGEHPKVMATVGPDFEEHRRWLSDVGVDTSGIRVIPELLTASFFVNTDQGNAQIASFYPGAMSRASELSFKELSPKPDLVMISPNDPQAMVAYTHECHELALPFFYDPSQQIVRLSSEDLTQGINDAQALFCNDYEFGLIQDKTGLSIEDVLRTTEFLIITRAADGADLYRAGSLCHVDAVQPQFIVEPTGVGDAFRGGFLKGYMRDLDLESCARMGVLAATYCIEGTGPQGHTFNLASFVQRYRLIFPDAPDLDPLLQA